MSKLSDLILLLALMTLVGLWLKLNRSRELAVGEARAQCHRHGLQLLDETVGLRGLRLRRIDGQRMLERCYAFEVSIDGDDREPGRLWMVGNVLTGLSLPTIELQLKEPGKQPSSTPANNVVPLRPRLGNDKDIH
ncbi:DUF3301 domain-containing protein [Dyella tabacisoli]|uniref:DUF3301 domain-containing protein n=1 Tax=Dyella tabacisoli TaxID=2282381 RepID=A0A369UP36_9GAMM|nr:DUF3301 domain-containing protein [Dyella tabacisoli]RDD82514.1 DUF3301 domain-containing protein [Dyella tabacisoli]